jgi:hypothetical protein
MLNRRVGLGAGCQADDNANREGEGGHVGSTKSVNVVSLAAPNSPLSSAPSIPSGASSRRIRVAGAPPFPSRHQHQSSALSAEVEFQCSQFGRSIISPSVSAKPRVFSCDAFAARAAQSVELSILSCGSSSFENLWSLPSVGGEIRHSDVCSNKLKLTSGVGETFVLKQPPVVKVQPFFENEKSRPQTFNRKA